MKPEHIAAAHAETPTCNAGAGQPFTCHSLKCRTRARELAVPAAPPPPVLTLVRSECANPLHEGCGGCDYPAEGVTCSICCQKPELPGVGVCADCDLCSYCGRLNVAPVLRGGERYCSAACADEDGEQTSEAPAFTWGRATEVMEKGGAR